MLFLSHYISPIGAITMASDGDNLIGLWFDGQKYDRQTLRNESTQEKTLPVFDQTRTWLDIYFSGQQPDFTPPLKLTGSDFRRRVCKILLTIPFGQTMTYGGISRIIAQERGVPTMSSQAVGGAVGHNPISIIVPCHRVLGAKGSLTGYAGGIDRKVWLLANEHIAGWHNTNNPLYLTK